MSRGLNLNNSSVNPQLGKYIEMPKRAEETELTKQKKPIRDRKIVCDRNRHEVKKGRRLKPIVVTNDEQIKDLVRPIGEWIPFERDEEVPLRDEDKLILSDKFRLSGYCETADFGEVFLGQLHRDSQTYASYEVVQIKAFMPYFLNEEYNRLNYRDPSVGFVKESKRAWMPLPEPYRRGHRNVGWIPCNKYLPKHKERVLVSTETEDIHITYYNKYAECFANNTRGEVVAWRPLPEPYEK